MIQDNRGAASSWSPGFGITTGFIQIHFQRRRCHQLQPHFVMIGPFLGAEQTNDVRGVKRPYWQIGSTEPESQLQI